MKSPVVSDEDPESLVYRCNTIHRAELQFRYLDGPLATAASSLCGREARMPSDLCP